MTKSKEKSKTKRWLLNFADGEKEIAEHKGKTKRELERLLKAARNTK
jgi:hypothetical protein